MAPKVALPAGGLPTTCQSPAGFDDNCGKKSPGSESRSTSAGTSSQSFGKIAEPASHQRSPSDPIHSIGALPDIEYPTPFVVKNTFIQFDTSSVVKRPEFNSLDGFLVERKVQSCPASGIAGSPGVRSDDTGEASSVWATRRPSTAPCDSLIAAVALASVVAAANAREEAPRLDGCRTPSSSWGSQNSNEPPVQWEQFSDDLKASLQVPCNSPDENWHEAFTEPQDSFCVPLSTAYTSENYLGPHFTRHGVSPLCNRAFEQFRVPPSAPTPVGTSLGNWFATGGQVQEQYCTSPEASLNAWYPVEGPSATYMETYEPFCRQILEFGGAFGEPSHSSLSAWLPDRDATVLAGIHERLHVQPSPAGTSFDIPMPAMATGQTSPSSWCVEGQRVAASMECHETFGRCASEICGSLGNSLPTMTPAGTLPRMWNGREGQNSLGMQEPFQASYEPFQASFAAAAAEASPIHAAHQVLDPRPPPPSQPPVLDASMRQRSAFPPPPPTLEAAPVTQRRSAVRRRWSAQPPPAECEEAPVLRLSDALLPVEPSLLPPVLGSEQLPSIGSTSHHLGGCRPCAFFYTRGCENAEGCPFCHLCGSGEKKRRLREKRLVRREAKYNAILAASG